jgi:hypothetical protein
MLTGHTLSIVHFHVFFINSMLELWDVLFQTSAALEWHDQSQVLIAISMLRKMVDFPAVH